ncbi:LamG-like jellyroll fold domain-containing protein [Thalassovita sp.]|uniref:LamG-like jellyroll fold domain-containing protein n=1 Tax=Thalassovita sp. TaxID=1979401 RepID=UPI0028818986|nr:LamG-like jellyroll fold domain-containing protein [Thalassovita sp.]MDF1801733.1 hypothetical protein [Thalassovita sp.]
MATFIETDATFPTDAGPILQADPAIDGGTLFCCDLLDAASWPTQAAPVDGDAIIDLAGIDNSAITVSGGDITWNDGFVFPVGSASRIVLPTSSDLASDVDKFAIAVWVEFTDLSGATESVLTMGKSGSGYDNTQYIVYTNGTDLRWGVVGEADLDTPHYTLSTGQVYALMITLEKNGADYDATLWVNGAAVDTHTVTGAMVDALTETAARIGQGDIFGTTPGMIVKRWNASDLTGWNAAEFVAADYAARQAEF